VIGGASLVLSRAAEWGGYISKGLSLAYLPKFAALLLPLAAVACGSGDAVEHTNAVTTEQLNAISQKTSEVDGTAWTTGPSTPDELGQSMRAGAAAKPRAR
jgi:hypothetical protein